MNVIRIYFLHYIIAHMGIFFDPLLVHVIHIIILAQKRLLNVLAWLYARHVVYQFINKLLDTCDH